MQKVFLSHSSKDKESYVRIVAQKLIKQIGEENVILDEITFQEGRRTIEEIEKNLQETDLFVIFISNSSLESDWVKQELFRAKELWDQKRLEQICPIVISENITFADTRIPKWLSDEYNLHYISRPNKAAQIIEQRIIELTFQRHPKLEERQKIFVGRNDLIALFEERMDNFEKEKPICIIASGIKSIGRKSLMRQCIYKGNVKSGSYPFPEFSMNYDESIEDFILKVYDLGFEEEMDLSGLFTKTMSEKVDIAAKLVSTMQKASDIIFIEDGGSIISQDGICAEWFTKVLEHYSVVKKFSVCIAAKYRLHAFPENTSFATKDKIYTIDVAELNKKERDGLLSRYLQFENMELELDDMRLISGLLSGYPEQVFYSVSIIKEKGIDYLRRNTNEIVEFNSKKASILLKEYEGNQEKLSVLAMLSLFDYVSLNMIRSIVDDNAHYMGFVDEFLSNSICEYVGALKEYIRVNETIKDYVMRNNYCILEEHK